MMCCNRRAEKRFFPAPIEADAAFVCMGFSLQTFPFRHCHVTFRDFASSSWIFRNRTRSALLHTNVPLRVPSATDDEVRPPQRPRARGRPCAAAREYRAPSPPRPRASCSRAASATATARGRRPCRRRDATTTTTTTSNLRRRRRRRRRLGGGPRRRTRRRGSRGCPRDVADRRDRGRGVRRARSGRRRGRRAVGGAVRAGPRPDERSARLGAALATDRAALHGDARRRRNRRRSDRPRRRPARRGVALAATTPRRSPRGGDPHADGDAVGRSRRLRRTRPSLPPPPPLDVRAVAVVTGEDVDALARAWLARAARCAADALPATVAACGRKVPFPFFPGGGDTLVVAVVDDARLRGCCAATLVYHAEECACALDVFDVASDVASDLVSHAEEGPFTRDDESDDAGLNGVPLAFPPLGSVAAEDRTLAIALHRLCAASDATSDAASDATSDATFVRRVVGGDDRGVRVGGAAPLGDSRRRPNLPRRAIVRRGV